MTDSHPTHRLPPDDWRDGSSYIFLGFVMHFHTSVCSCGARDSWSETLRVFGHRNYVATNARRYLPYRADTLPRDEPVAVYDMPEKHTPICHRCINAVARPGEEIIHLRLASDERNWFAALMEDQRRAWRESVSAKRDTPTKPTVTDDVLLNM